MTDPKLVAAVACGLTYFYFRIKRRRREGEIGGNVIGGSEKKRRKRRCWMNNIHKNRTREALQEKFNQLLNEPSGQFDNFCCMAYSDFELLLSNILPMISKKDTHFREAIPAKCRLAITLRYLASGDSFRSLHEQFNISVQCISKIVREVCKAINEVLNDEIKMPSTEEEWMAIERGYSSKFPHCIGSLDGKLIALLRPAHSGTESPNDKKTAMGLIALVDSEYKFIYAEIVNQEIPSDGGVFNNSLLLQRISGNKINIPPPSPLPGSDKAVPYVFIADNAFPLSTHVMKPYPGEHEDTFPKGIFNKCLSRSRIVVENTFGVLTSVFGIFRRPIDLDPETVSFIVMTSILLHNYLRKSVSSAERYSPPGTFDVYDKNDNLTTPGFWRRHEKKYSAIRNLPYIPHRSTLGAKLIREEFTSYFCNLEGDCDIKE